VYLADAVDTQTETLAIEEVFGIEAVHLDQPVIVLVDRFCASAAGWLDVAARDAVDRYVRNIRVGPAEAGSPAVGPRVLPRVIVVLAVVVRRPFLAAGADTPDEEERPPSGVDGAVDSPITDALLQAFRVSEPQWLARCWRGARRHV
jgi:hypothetical protein